MDYNLNKGKIIFWETINKALNDFNPEEQDRIKQLASSFENNVGVMPNEDENIYAAKRLATALLEIGPEKSDSSIDLVPVKILDKYKTLNSSTSISKSNFIPVDKTLAGNFGKVLESQEDDFEKEIRSFQEDSHFDLIDDVENSELSIEGMRKKIIIPGNFNTDKDTLPELKNDKILGKIWFTDNGEIEKVECPHCQSFDSYYISHNKFGCFKCDKEFETPMEMADLIN